MTESLNIELAIKNFPAQQTIFDSPARIKVVSKGRRFGLTRGAANDFIKCALSHKFKNGLWVDTVHPNITRYVERYFMPHLQRLPQNMWHWRKQEKILQIGGSFIDFRSADRPENIEGFGYDKFFLNEAGIVLKNEYIWHNAIKPMLWDFKNSTGVIGGTPKGRGLFYELSLLGRSTLPEDSDYEFFTFTSFDNPYRDRSILERDIATTPERVVKQEFYAEFLEDTGVVFRGYKEIATAQPKKPIEGHLYIIGCDLAQVQDFTVMCVYDRADNHQVYQERINKLEWPFIKQKIIQLSRFYNNALVYLDATGLGAPIADDLVRARTPVEPVKFTNESKKQMVEKMSIWMQQQKFHILNIPETIAEFESFTYDVSKSGRIQYNAPVGLHDDIVFAHALAIWGLQPVMKKDQFKIPTIIELAKQRALEGDYYDDSPFA